MLTYNDYLKHIKNSVITPVYKIDFLNDDETVRMSITDDVISNGNISGSNENGVRRTSTITLFNKGNKYSVSPSDIWVRQKVKIQAGIRINNEDYLIPQGVYYVEQASPERTGGRDVIVLKLVDKWGGLDGTVYGKLPYNLQFLVELEEVVNDEDVVVKYDYNMYEIIKILLKKNRRYDVNIIDYIPNDVPEFLDSGVFNKQGINEVLEKRLRGGLFSIKKDLSFIQIASSGNIYRCINNEANMDNYNPEWMYFPLSESEIIDPVEPLLDTYYMPYEKDGLTFLVEEDSFYPEKAIDTEKLPYGLLTLPRDLIATRGETEGDLLLTIAELLSAEMGYNREGQLYVVPTDREIKYEEKPVIHRFRFKDYIYSLNASFSFGEIVNQVVAVMNMKDGVSITGTATNENLETDFCVQKIGVHPYIYEFEYAYNRNDYITENDPDGTVGIERQLTSFAQYYLNKHGALQNSVSITCPYLPHIKEGDVIEIQNKENGSYEKYLINSISLPLRGLDNMSINCTSIRLLGGL